MRIALTGLVLSVSLLLSPLAKAEVIRFAVIVGTNRGHVDDIELKYAESDANKLSFVLRELGNFHPANIALLRNDDGPTFRKTLVAINERIRQVSSRPNTQTLLFVYYSGHADSTSLRLKSTRFPINELGSLVRGSAATFRVLVLDSCRSGTLTRVKGGTVVAPFKIRQESRLRGEGVAFLTASSANEDAQESDEIKGSFFTHGFVSALMGAADRDRDGSVVLEEAYRYAYDATVRASSRSYAGVQHPTFQFDFRGDDGLVLTRLRQKHRGTVLFPSNVGFLIFKSGPLGAVVGEVGPRDGSRRLSLAPGSYFLRGRGEDYLLEGSLNVSAGTTQTVDLAELDRVEYARLVRKGVGLKSISHGPELALGVRSPLPIADTLCPSLSLGYRLETRDATFLARASACRATSRNELLSAKVHEYSAAAAALFTWDLPGISLSGGAGAGVMFARQHFATSGSAPIRVSTHPYAFIVGAVTKELFGRVYSSLEITPYIHLLRLQGNDNATPQREAHFSVGTNLAVGALF